VTPLGQLGAYQATSVLTASPGRLVFLMMDAAVRHLESARRGFEVEDPADRFNTIGTHLGKSVDIIRELRKSLSRSEGGELAGHLEALYEFLEERIFEANIRKNAEMLVPCTTMLAGLRDSWAQMLQNQTPSTLTPPAPRSPDSAGFDVRT